MTKTTFELLINNHQLIIDALNQQTELLLDLERELKPKASEVRLPSLLKEPIVKAPVLEMDASDEPEITSSGYIHIPNELLRLFAGENLTLADIHDQDFFNFSFIQVDRIYPDGTIQFRRWQSAHQFIKEVRATPAVAEFMQPNQVYLVHYTHPFFNNRPKEVLNWAATTNDIKSFRSVAKSFQPLMNQYLKSIKGE